MVSLALLAWLTLRSTRKLYAVRMNWKRCLATVLLSIALAGFSLLCREVVGYRISLSMALLIGSGATLVFVYTLLQMRLPWLSFFWNLAISRRQAKTS